MAGFSSPPDVRAYYTAVWRIVQQVPAGKVITYGQISRLIPVPYGMDPKSYLAFAPRWVGGALANCPSDVPWQRVVNAQGKISIRPGTGENIQKQLLESEGVQFDEKGRINLAVYGWAGPSTND